MAKVKGKTMADLEKEQSAAPKSNAPGAEAPAKKEKKLIEGITRGRMPIAVVNMVRFGDNKLAETKDLATMFGTTVGKITDIKKNSTFAYLVAGFKPTAEQKADGIAWLQRHIGYDEGKVDKLINELEKTKVATAEEAAAFDAIRSKAKGQKEKTKTGEVADAGGGNRAGKKKATAKDLVE